MTKPEDEYEDKFDTTDVTGVPPRNYLPPELVAEMIERQGAEFTRLERMATAHAEPLSDAQAELLVVLTEECAETIQRATKIQRFGLRVNPWTGLHNRDTLETEIADIMAIVDLLNCAAVINAQRVHAKTVEKIGKLAVPDGRLRFALEHAKITRDLYKREDANYDNLKRQAASADREWAKCNDLMVENATLQRVLDDATKRIDELVARVAELEAAKQLRISDGEYW